MKIYIIYELFLCLLVVTFCPPGGFMLTVVPMLIHCRCQATIRVRQCSGLFCASYRVRISFHLPSGSNVYIPPLDNLSGCQDSHMETLILIPGLNFPQLQYSNSISPSISKGGEGRWREEQLVRVGELQQGQRSGWQ